jgi:hypothetical protein
MFINFRSFCANRSSHIKKTRSGIDFIEGFYILRVMQQFEQFSASEVYCPRCRQAQPVREKLLLVLPHSEIYDLRCEICGESLASREVHTPPQALHRMRSGVPPHSMPQ